MFVGDDETELRSFERLLRGAYAYRGVPRPPELDQTIPEVVSYGHGP